jgi:predicted dinucleotide-binding enzyme
MKVGVLGTGVVGKTIGTRLLGLGHEVWMGSRSAHNETAAEWAAEGGDGAGHGTFSDAAEFGEVLFNGTAGASSIDALTAAGEGNLADKTLIDVANPLDFSHGMPPTLTIANDDSLAETIQRTFPYARVVKALNTVNCRVMVEPSRVPGDHVVFVCSDHPGAKAEAGRFLMEFGWTSAQIIDLGGIRAARTTEMYLPLWVTLMQKLGTADFNIALSR